MRGATIHETGCGRWLAALVTVTALASAEAAAGPAGRGDAVRGERARLEGRGAGAPLGRVLAAVAARTGIEIIVHGETDEVVSEEFSEAPIEAEGTPSRAPGSRWGRRRA
jgi:hypothetical protein